MPDSFSRRALLSRSLHAAGAAVAAQTLAPLLPGETMPTASADEKTAADNMPIVDTHQHLLDMAKFRIPWAPNSGMQGDNWATPEYLAVSRGLNIGKTVYMEVDLVPEQQVQEAEYVIDLCRRNDNPMVAAVISGRPASDGFAAYINKYKDSPFIKGVRQIMHVDATPPGFCLDKQIVKNIQLLGDLGMTWDICLRSGELMDGDKLVAQCPRTRFILDHCGNMSVQETDPAKRKLWMDGMKALAQRSNVVCKISGIIGSAKPDWKPADLAPNMRFAMETFGPDRRMFAGDWPVCTRRATLAQWVAALKEIVRDMGMSAADQRKLFHDNAVAFYGLKDKNWTAPQAGKTP